ncbi:uncharacterized mitochondrial protein AtMg00310-like [Vicia villosa]|uniref:uncharacterized mitochondrial protein AtMg00310-like n=1 Tax=Vicia villosa TaxID=3911 RepID=UPI00273BDF2C|nr:uncharacterized mitochondrial protein AtMg00310-like [Vicia villosa]
MIKNRLEGWTNRFLNLGGRITLLKSVLSSLAIFTLSLYNIPKKVAKKITSIQSKFLWGGVEERRRIHWVKWEDVTLPLNKGGLGVKNIVLFNLALLNKWRWRIIQRQESLWFKVLNSRYGEISSTMFVGSGGNRISSNCSVWWKDVVKSIYSTSFDPIEYFCRFSIHNGFSTPFWEARWLYDRSLKELFLDLYGISQLKCVSVAAMGGWKEGEWIWGDFGVSDVDTEQSGLVEVFVDFKGRLEGFMQLKSKGFELKIKMVIHVHQDS